MHGKAEGSLLLPIQIGRNIHDEGTVPGATVSSNLHSQILDSSQYITFNDAGQHSTRMRNYFHCHQHFTRMRNYFHHHCNHFIDNFDDPVLDGAVIYAGDIPFQDNEQGGMYTEILDNKTWNIFLLASRDHECLLGHAGTALHISHTSLESSKANHNTIKKSTSNSTT